LVVVAATALVAAVAASRAGNVQLGRGLAFGAVSLAGAVAVAKASTLVDQDILLAAFARGMLLVAALMVMRQRRGGVRTGPSLTDDPIISLRPKLACQCPRALKMLATAVGVLTDFLGVGGGFLIVPSLVLVLAMPMKKAAGTSPMVIT
jgi:uncharacterized membrane protein YfcA